MNSQHFIHSAHKKPFLSFPTKCFTVYKKRKTPNSVFQEFKFSVTSSPLDNFCLFWKLYHAVLLTYEVEFYKVGSSFMTQCCSWMCNNTTSKWKYFSFMCHIILSVCGQRLFHRSRTDADQQRVPRIQKHSLQLKFHSDYSVTETAFIWSVLFLDTAKVSVVCMCACGLWGRWAFFTTWCHLPPWFLLSQILIKRLRSVSWLSRSERHRPT